MRGFEREITLVCGKTGKGKSQWTKERVKHFRRVIILDPLGEYDNALRFDDMEQLIDHVSEYRTFRVAVSDLRDFALVCRICETIGNVTLVIEESQRVIPSGALALPVEFEDIVYRGRHSGVSIIMVCQRASTVHIAPRSQFTRLIAFNQTEARDLTWIDSCSGFDVSDQIRRLAPLEYFEITASGFVKKKILKFVK